MKRIITALLLCFPLLATAQTPLKTNFDGCTPEHTLFFAYTVDHKKAVEFCVVPGAYRYTYGGIDRPNITVTALPGQAGVIKRVDPDGTVHTGFAIRRNDKVYMTQRGPKGYDAKLVVNKHEEGRVAEIAVVRLEDLGWGFIDRSTERGVWPEFYETSF